MKQGTRGFPFIVCLALWLVGLSTVVYAEGASTELVVLSTTDMHGKCWETDLLTGVKVTQNMLRVSTAVQQFRDAYAPEHVILIDNGDLFQGTPISEEHLLHAEHPEDEPEAMALCLAEIGYDAMTLGNHEFNYPWATMRRVYDWLEERGVRVLAANVCYDGADGVHQRGENAFGTYIVREVAVNGRPHKVGILGLENTDVTLWDVPLNYPGLQFAHPDNPDYELAQEAARYIAQMREDGCEIIIVCYHGGLGDADEKTVFGINSENQGMRIVNNTEDIDLLILGHDHTSAYSCATVMDKAGREVYVVNGGGQELTKAVFRLSEDAQSGLICELAGIENLSLAGFQPDPDLQEKIRPYAELADATLDLPVGELTGEWDGSEAFFTVQTDAVDLINAAMMAIGTERMQEKYGQSGLEALQAATGLDHLDVDASFSTPANGGYIPRSGPISTREVYSLYRFANNQLILPMYGRDILAVLEENASQRLTSRVLRGTPYFLPMNDPYTHLICGGVNFRYDMSKPSGERVVIDGFSNGRPFQPDTRYLVAVNNYIIGNDRCGLRAFSSEDAVWSQQDEGKGGTIQEMVKEYVARETERAGGLSPEAFNWRWSVTYSEDPAAMPAYEGRTVAVLADRPQDGRAYVLYNEAQGCTLTDHSSSDGLEAIEIHSHGDALVDALPDDALVFTAHEAEKGLLTLTDPDGRYLTCGESGGLFLTDAPADGRLSLWQLVEIDGGYNIKSADTGNNRALQCFEGRITTYQPNASDVLMFNFYEVIADNEDSSPSGTVRQGVSACPLA